jgi:hypothetical protein
MMYNIGMAKYTSYYTHPGIDRLARLEHRRAVPVRISWGTPRFRLPYRGMMQVAPEIYPEMGMQRLTPEEYIPLYTDILEEEGVDAIAQRLNDLSRGDYYDLILLCFCKPGLPCHRFYFADWWFAKTGEKITEL